MSNTKYALGVDIGGSHVSCCAIDMNEKKILKNTLKREHLSHTDSADNIFKTWAKAINECMAVVGKENVIGLGFAIPGPFNYKEGISKLEHKYPNLFNLHIPTELNKYLEAEKEMRFLNDATSFAVGVSWLGKGKDSNKIVVVTLGTGFGSAYIESGLPLVEREDVAPEGCFWHLPFKDGIADDYISTGWFTREYKKRTGEEIAGVKEIIETPVASEIFTEFGNNLGTFLAPWLKKFNADIVIMGGNISLAYSHFEEVLNSVLKEQGVQTKIVVSELMEDAAMVGAARLFDNDFWQKVSKTLPNI